jgi:hypothetical protein
VPRKLSARKKILEAFVCQKMVLPETIPQPPLIAEWLQEVPSPGTQKLQKKSSRRQFSRHILTGIFRNFLRTKLFLFYIESLIISPSSF